MGTVVSRSASAERIAEAASKTMTVAVARGGDIKAQAEARLSTFLSALASNEQQLNQARNQSDVLHATLMARDNESDLEIGSVIDEIWNTLGRPAQSIDYDLIVGSGKNAWTDGDPTKQSHMMGVLAANIRASNNPKLAEKKAGWAEASAALETADAQVTALAMQRRTLAGALQVGLARFKRDLKNLGMTESQVHEIIPDTPTGSSAATPAPTATASAPSGTGATNVQQPATTAKPEQLS
jgi:hypothetical protein